MGPCGEMATALLFCVCRRLILIRRIRKKSASSCHFTRTRSRVVGQDSSCTGHSAPPALSANLDLSAVVQQAGRLRGGCLPPPPRANVPVGRLPIGRSLPSCPTTAPSALRAHTLGFPPICQGIAPASTSISHTPCLDALSYLFQHPLRLQLEFARRSGSLPPNLPRN